MRYLANIRQLLKSCLMMRKIPVQFEQDISMCPFAYIYKPLSYGACVKYQYPVGFHAIRFVSPIKADERGHGIK